MGFVIVTQVQCQPHLIDHFPKVCIMKFSVLEYCMVDCSIRVTQSFVGYGVTMALEQD